MEADSKEKESDENVLLLDEQLINREDKMAASEAYGHGKANGVVLSLGSAAANQKYGKRLGEILLTEGVLDEQNLRLAIERQQKTGGFLGETIAALGLVPTSALGAYLERNTGFPFVDLSEESIDFHVARLIPEETARRRMALAFAESGDEIKVAFADPLNIATIDEVSSRLGKRISPYMAFAFDLEEGFSRAYDIQHRSASVLSEITDALADSDLAAEDLLGMASDAPIVRLVNGIFAGAVAAGASDIHIEPQEDSVRVRYRIDGYLYDQMQIPRASLAACISRIKIVSRMNIAERRRPQDGRFAYREDSGPEYDMRVSVMPTVFGEKAVLRILAKSNAYASIDRLGFFPEQRSLFEQFIKRPHGIVLVTGPTGSGKSTTLFAALQKINSPHLNINTIEDPVEYNLPGVNQVPVNEKIGVTFAAGLRTLVRQDPDVIMVGEIRDAETAEIAVQAALTGHLVLSTLHTNDAPGALIRLQNMGIEPYLIASSVIGIVGQRLMRNVCPHCREWLPATKDFLSEFDVPYKNGKPTMVPAGKGCFKCGGRGTRGRQAAFEVMPMTEPLRELLTNRASGVQIKEQAIKEGMMTMKQAGVKRVLDGTTTVEELVRVLYTEGE